jgi:Flp pilus assembly protein TadB
MRITLTLFLIAALLFAAFKTIYTARATKSHSYIGRGTLIKLSGGVRRRSDIWAAMPFRLLLAAIARLVYTDEAAWSKLSKDLSKAGLAVTPREYLARKYLIIMGCACLAALCVLLKIYLGIVFAVLLLVYGLMKHRDALDTRIRKKDAAIAREMPRFVKTICRGLQSDRDLHNVVGAYRKVAGIELGGELDILLAELETGNTQSALIHFENRLGTPEAFRLCAALRDMSTGVDQTATLGYMADDMARQAKENIRKELSLRPGKMRRTYYPAIGVCIAMILYVLVVYVVQNLNHLF